MLNGEIAGADETEDAAFRPRKMPRGDGAGGGGPLPGRDLPVEDRLAGAGLLRNEKNHRPLPWQPGGSVVRHVGEELDRCQALPIGQSRHRQKGRRPGGKGKG